jgi:hypothetical protein
MKILSTVEGNSKVYIIIMQNLYLPRELACRLIELEVGMQ